MEIQPTGANAPAPSRPEPTHTGRAISSDFETFLKMLTTQLQNQDPLKPIESADYAVQLATFSGVEQQVKTNDLLKSLVGQLSGSGLERMAGWVGMEARVAAPRLFDGAPITLFPKPDAEAKSAELVVKDGSGAIVSRQPVSLDEGQIQWAGTDSSGNPLPPGRYSFELESRADGKVLSSTPVESYAPVTEVRMENGEATIVLAGGVSRPASAVSALRLPPSG